MALTWNLTDIDDYENRCWVPSQDDPEKVQLAPLTEALIFATVGVGIGEITDQDWPEFYGRLKITEKFYGHLLYEDSKPYKITPEDVRSHIGLKTNVFPKEPRTTFYSKVLKWDLEDYVREAKRYEKDSVLTDDASETKNSGADS